jgi:sec-independent protein translocase protein TatB
MMGQATSKVKKMAREFSRAMEDAAEDSGVGDITSSLRNIANPKKMGLDALKTATDFSSYNPGSETEKLAKDRSKEREKNKLAVEKRRQEKAVKNTDVDSVDNEFEVVVKATNKDKNIRAPKLKPKVKIAKKKPSKKSTKKKDTIL